MLHGGHYGPVASATLPAAMPICAEAALRLAPVHAAATPGTIRITASRAVPADGTATTRAHGQHCELRRLPPVKRNLGSKLHRLLMGTVVADL